MDTQEPRTALSLFLGHIVLSNELQTAMVAAGGLACSNLGPPTAEMDTFGDQKPVFATPSANH